MLSPVRCSAALIAALVMTSPAEAASVGVCGGSGGAQSKTLSCPSGQYIVGLFQRRGLYTDRIGIRCASIDAAGKRGKPGAFQFAGGTGGSSSSSRTCAGSRAVISFGSLTGSYIDNVNGGTCARRNAQGAFIPENPPVQIGLSGANTGGSQCDLECSDGEAMHKLIVRYGSWIDSIEAFCRP